MGNFINLRADANVNSKFFAQLACEAMFKGFIWFDFAARKFPEAAEMIARAALCDEKLPVAKDETCRNVDDFAHAWRLAADALVDPAECFEFFRIEQISAVEQDRTGHHFAGAFEIELLENGPFGGDDNRIAAIRHRVHV